MKKAKIFMVAMIVVATSAMGLLLTGCSQKNYDFTIGILSGAQIPAFELGTPGFQNRLRELMDEEGKTVRFIYQNAAGDNAMSTTIANSFAMRRVDLIFSLGTGASQAAIPAAYTAGIPLVYGIITDPAGNGLVTPNSTGSSSALPADSQISLLEELLGGSLNSERRIAFLYTTDEPNSVASLRRLEGVAPDDTIVPFGITANGLPQIINQMIAINADPTIAAIYIPQDNQITSPAGMQSVQDNNRLLTRLPVVVADLPIVERGAVASLSVCFTENGARAAEIAFRILVGGESPEDIRFGDNQFYSPTAENLALWINKGEAEALGFEVPSSLVERAKGNGRVID